MRRSTTIATSLSTLLLVTGPAIVQTQLPWGETHLHYNLDTDPKELFNLFGRSGGVASFEPMVRDVMAPYPSSLRQFPNNDYSKMTRDK